MIKIYKSNSELSFNITVGGKRRRIVFDSYSGGGSQYISTDKQEQERIEKLPFFGSLFRLSQNESEESEKEPVEIKLENVPGISKCPDAKAYLETKGITVALRSKESIKKAAYDIGINFPDL